MTTKAGTALIIGVGSENGVGGALCRRFAREGFHVIACGRTEAKVAGVAESIRGAGHEASHAVGDTTEIDGVIDGEVVNTKFPGVKEHFGEGGMLKPDDIAESYWMLHSQPKTAWTLELDIRPDRESF